jgi:Reverse transcriptase (RNA-dependent DNA polymerase)
VKNIFLHGDLEENIYMDVPPGYQHFGSGPRRKVCRLEKELYGLKQSPKAWFGRFCKALKGFGYTQGYTVHTIFF